MVGSIKTYTPKYSFIIPKFDVATWHDYIESNFRAIDALLYNVYGINNFKGEWIKLTEYKAGDVVFIGEDTDSSGEPSEYEGRLVKVIVDHTTDNSDGFHYFYELHPDYYELYFDANNAAYFAQKSKESADASEVSYQNSKNLETIYINYRDLTEEYKNLAQDAATNASNSEQSALTAASTAINTVQAATDLLNTTQQYTEAAIETITNTRDEAVETVTTVANEAKTIAENAITSVENTKTEAENTINATVEQGRVTIQSYVDNAEEEVREIARVEAQEAIACAKQEVQDYTDTTIKPSLQEYVDNSANNAQIAQESAGIAASNANASIESANNSANSATSSHNSAITAEEWARYAEGKANPNWGYIGGDLENQTDLMNKFREIELFKFPNATIIGEPTIQNGQVSNFSVSSYLQFPFILDLHDKAFQIDMCFTTATNVQTQQNILDSKFGIALAIQNGKGVMAISYNGASWDIGSVTGTQTLQSNTTYYARLIWNKLQYKTQLSTDGVNYVDDMIITDTRRPFPTTIFIGGCDIVETGHPGHPFLGTINMNNCSLSVMDNVIWQGMDDAGLSTRADISLSNLDEVGEKRFTDLQDVIAIKANDSNAVHKTNNETINGIKSFIGDWIEFLKSNVTKGFRINPYYSGGADIGLMGNDDNWLGKIFFNPDGAIQIVSSNQVTIKAPTDNTTTSLQADTVGARNTKLLQYRTLIDQNVIDATKQPISTALNYNHISNCITEIPQNIKLELVDGHPVIKAGSKIPMIGSTYSEITLTNDYRINFQTTWQESDGLIFYISNRNYQQSWGFVAMNRSLSGDTLPTELPGNTYIWFDAVNRVYKGTTSGGHENWIDLTNASYPLAAVHFKNGVVTEILKDSNGNDMIFNGAGFIGHHAFVLPGIKGLKSNGFNDDKSLASNEWHNDSLQIVELGYNQKNIMNRITGCAVRNYFDDINDAPNDNSKDEQVGYDKEKNQMYYRAHGTNNWSSEKGYYINLVDYNWNGTTVTQFDIHQPVRLATTEMLGSKVDISASNLNTQGKSLISSLGMPSNRYIDLTLGASGAEYIAPANGWYVIRLANTGLVQHWVNVDYNYNYLWNFWAQVANNTFGLPLIPVKKGSSLKIWYGTDISGASLFRFYYAEGEN